MSILNQHLVAQAESFAARSDVTDWQNHEISRAVAAYKGICRDLDDWGKGETFYEQQGNTLGEMINRANRYERQFIALVYGKNPRWAHVR